MTHKEATGLLKKHWHRRLNRTERDVLEALLNGTRRRKPVPDINKITVKAKVPTIARAVNVSDRYVTKCMKKLAAVGLITVIPAQGKPSAYNVHIDSLLKFENEKG